MVPDRKGLVSFKRKCIQEGKIGSSRYASVDDAVGNGPFLIDETLNLTGSPEFASFRAEAARSCHHIRMRSRSGLRTHMFLGP